MRRVLLRAGRRAPHGVSTVYEVLRASAKAKGQTSGRAGARGSFLSCTFSISISISYYVFGCKGQRNPVQTGLNRKPK